MEYLSTNNYRIDENGVTYFAAYGSQLDELYPENKTLELVIRIAWFVGGIYVGHNLLK